MLRAIAPVLVVIALASAAEAGWRETRWGMSEAAFRAVAPEGPIIIEGVTTAGPVQMEFTLHPHFHDGRLAQLTLAPISPRFCAAALVMLVATYGKLGHVTGANFSWRDLENVIFLSRNGDDCQISYHDPAGGLAPAKKPGTAPGASTGAGVLGQIRGSRVIAPAPNTTGF